MRRCAWVSLVVAAVSFCAVAWPVPMVAADAIVSTDARHYETRLSGVHPAVPGVTAQVDPRGGWIEVGNATARRSVILGYAREPFLRIDAAGVQ
jgi:hypothetical protein